MFQYLNWVADLKGISPIARLLGFRMANSAGYTGDGIDLGPDDPACEIDLDAALAWIGCQEGELRAATNELIREGVSPLRIEGGKILYSFPPTPEPDWPKSTSRRDYLMTIYVISAQPNISKIGISKYPEYRLENLQAANPTQRLIMVWRFGGPATVIRRIERQAHAALANNALGNEWFTVTAEVAIQAIEGLLAKAGVKA